MHSLRRSIVSLPGAVPVTLSIRLTLADGVYTLAIQDNGIGLPDTFDPVTSRSLGLKLANSLQSTSSGQRQRSFGITVPSSGSVSGRIIRTRRACDEEEEISIRKDGTECPACGRTEKQIIMNVNNLPISV